MSDQGAVVSVNGGQSWSSWYNQPTAQLYHVNADNDFPYRVCSGQQESGSACVSSRGNDGQITLREWHPANGVVEYGYAVPDPLNPNIVYGSGVTRYDRSTGQFSSNRARRRARRRRGRQRRRRGRRPGPAHHAHGAARRFRRRSARDVLRRRAGVEDDQRRKGLDVDQSQLLAQGVGSAQEHRQVRAPTRRRRSSWPRSTRLRRRHINTLRLWVGTDDGMIQTTADGGKTWSDVTPPTMTPFMKVFNMDAGHFDALTAYAAGNTLRTDDMRPHLFRTHDGGKTWTEINTGLENAGPTSTIREDPKKAGLLYAGSERHVWVSFDDGNHWQTLKLNMASSSVRDLTVKDDDLIAATHGRGFWILDNVTPLRQISAASSSEAAMLFKPADALRVRWNTNSDTPMPPDEPNMPNPPEGASIDYYLKSAASGPVVLEILTTDGQTGAALFERGSRHAVAGSDRVVVCRSTGIVRRRACRRLPACIDSRGTCTISRWAAVRAAARAGGLPIAAVPYNTVNPPSTPWVNPGTYTVKLTVDGKSYTQPITVKQDPRVKTPALVMQTIYAETKAAYFGAIDAQDAARQAQGLRDQIAAMTPKPTGAVADAVAAFDKKVQTLIGAAPAGAGGGRGGPGGGGGGGARGGGAGGARGGGGAAGAGAAAAGGAQAAAPPQPAPQAAPGAPAAAVTLSGAGSALSGVMNSLQAADVEPTTNQMTAIAAAKKTAAEAMTAWTTIKTVDLPAINLKLKTAGIAPLKVQ